MIDAIMMKLHYINPPEYNTYASYREYLRKSADYSCAYCTTSESEAPGATFNIEHFKPRKFFPSLAAKCENLRYSCPRCNSYKGDLWIPEARGCSRNCKECAHHVCQENIERFIDPMKEDPSKVIFLGKDDKLYAYADSKPANYTIRYLRLNRAQLIKLRHVRRFMDSWLEELKDKRKKAVDSLDEIRAKQNSYCEVAKISASEQSSTYHDVIVTMYEMMATQAEQSLLFIDEEIRKLNILIRLRSGCDEIIADDKKHEKN
ncbi:MAG: hypothetical protein RR413_08020 [Christensenellaceae bacterium]